MAFGKRGAPAASRPQRTFAKVVDGGVVPHKPTKYDAQRKAAVLAKAATDEADARYARMAVVGMVVVVALAGLYSLASLYLFAAPPKI